jgi:hypothetical protein
VFIDLGNFVIVQSAQQEGRFLVRNQFDLLILDVDLFGCELVPEQLKYIYFTVQCRQYFCVIKVY